MCVGGGGGGGGGVWGAVLLLFRPKLNVEIHIIHSISIINFNDKLTRK